MKILQVLALFVIALAATDASKADFKIAQSGKVVDCYGPDNMVVTLNATRTTVKISIEGESSGPSKVNKVSSNNKSFVRYETKQGVLILGTSGDSFTFAGDSTSEAYTLTCKAK